MPDYYGRIVYAEYRKNTMKIYTLSEIRQCEQWAGETIPAFELMKRTGHAAFNCLRNAWPEVKKITVLAGTGNNAGDGYLLAAEAAQQGLGVQLWQMGDLAGLTKEAAQAVVIAKAAGVFIQEYELGASFDGEVIVDALLGIGFHGPLKRLYAEVIHDLNKSGRLVLSIDVPSGLDAETGAIPGNAVNASVTITFIGVKRGMVTGEGATVSGHIIVDDLQLPASLLDRVTWRCQSIDDRAQKILLPRRPLNCHKKQFGQVLVVGGNVGYAGAVHMASMAAMRVGAGMVTIATHPLHAAVLDVALSEVMCRGISKARQLDDLLEQTDVIVVGPGLGSDNWSVEVLKKILTSELPMVVDADALRFVAKKEMRRDNWVLTPHPGEAGLLLQETPVYVQRDRYSAVEKIQKKHGGVCVLKGAGTLILGEGGMTHVCREGNPGMATAGMGDVLSGVIAGLIAQGLSLEQAASLGVLFHARAADATARVYGERGLMATDL